MKLVKSTAIGLVLAAIAHAQRNRLPDQKWEPVCGRFCGEAEDCLSKMEGRVEDFPKPDGPESEVRLVGEKAPLGVFPWAVAFRSYGNELCGGTIINRKTILTSASCFARKNGRGVDRPKKSKTKVYVGFGQTLPSTSKSHDGLGDEVYKGRGIFDIARIDIHHRYKPATGSYDAAVVTIKGSIQYDGSIHPHFEAEYGGMGPAGYSHSRPACFSSRKYDKEYLERGEDGKHEASCYTIGYGQGEDGQSGTLNFQNETVIINRETCRQRLETLPKSKQPGRLATFRKRNGKEVLDPSYLCTTNSDETVISCHNDVGSSVQCVNSDFANNVQPGMVNVAINSWSNVDCATPDGKNVPSINTRVAGISAWVIKMAKRHGGSKAQYTNE